MVKLIKSPTKEVVRRYMQQRQADHCPPPDMKQIRRQLGWDLLEAKREDTKR
jgi:hypothetical protein